MSERKKIAIRPTHVNPEHSRFADGAGCNARGYQGMINPEAIRRDDNEVAAWGVRRPDPRGGELRNFYDAIGGVNGSYNRGTPFTADFQQSIPEGVRPDAKVKKVTVCYRLCHVRYTKANSGYWHDPGIYYAEYVSGSRKRCATEYTISLNNFTSQPLSCQGQGLRPQNVITKNDIYYSANEIPLFKTVLFDDNNSNYTIQNLKNSHIRFVLPRNLEQDVSKIVMRDLWLEIEYENVTPKFQLEELSASKNSLTNCADDYSTINIRVRSVNGIPGPTKIKINGSGIDKATITNTNLTKIKDNDNSYYLLWDVRNLDTNLSASTSFDVHYNDTGNFKIQTIVQENADGLWWIRDISLKVEDCRPSFNFEFLDNQLNPITSGYAPYTNGNYIFSDYDDKKGFFKVTFSKNKDLKHSENIVIDMAGLELLTSPNEWNEVSIKPNSDGWYINHNGVDISNKITIKQDGTKYIFTGFSNYTIQNVVFACQTRFDTSGKYTVSGEYKNLTKTEWSYAPIKYNIIVKGAILGKEYFKLRLEDGSDVRYNSLMITEGDDLKEPILYTPEEIENYVKDMTIVGEKKRIPLGEAQYVKFDIKINNKKNINLKKVLTYIDISYPPQAQKYGEDILIGTGKGITLLNNQDDKVAVIDEISSTKTTTVELIVKSDFEMENVQIKLKPFNYDRYDDNGGWIPANIMFKDIPNVKISIEGITDLQYNEQDSNDGFFWLYYKIQNLSDTQGKNVRFQIREPSQFKKIEYSFIDEDGSNAKAPWFNKNNRIVTFPILEANSKEYIIAIKYQATKKGIYNFIIHTLDNIDDLDDDQYSNSYQHTLLVNIDSDVRITTDVNNSLPYIYELIDFHINIKNFYKDQKEFIIDVYDIGTYEIDTHKSQDYFIEYVHCPDGVFTPSTDNNKLGTWKLNNIKANAEYDLTLSMRPQDIGNHFLKTTFINNTHNNNTKKDLYNEVKVIEKDKQISFNAYHAIDETGEGCKDCSKLTPICDDDFINLGDDIYYVLEITNNSRNDITNTLHAYARLPKTFLENGILCSSHKYTISQDNQLISFSIPKLNGCNKDDKTVRICFKVKPSAVGTFYETFTLVTRNAKILYKKLKLIVDNQFNEKKLEHEITIYNFDKTNRYYRYEVDNKGDLYKFFNRGDKTYRPIRTETYNKSAVEVYRGSNLRKLVKDIKKYSKYVDPILLREGENGFKDKAYELYPDGFIRRFGLLNSEVYHYSNQLPETTDLVLKAMKWDVDPWDMKLWASDKYDNGVFDLTIDYAKVPSNFNILDNAKSRTKNLQNLVDNVKPYGTKAICYYSATVEASMNINVDDVQSLVNTDINAHIKLPDDFETISEYNRHDNSLFIYHDLMKIALDIEIDNIKTYIDDKDIQRSDLSSKVDQVTTSVYGDSIVKKYIDECFDLVVDSYRIKRTIDIIQPLPASKTLINNINDDIALDNNQIINFTNNLLNKESIGLMVYTYKDSRIYVHGTQNDKNLSNQNLKCIFTKDDINGFNGFKVIVNDNTVYERNFHEKISTGSIQIQKVQQGSDTILHFWGSINESDYYHIGYAFINNIANPVATSYSTTNEECNIKRYWHNEKIPISFTINNSIHEVKKDFDEIYPIESNYRWSYLQNINSQHNQYALFENNADIDPECSNRFINIPKLMLKYNNFDISDYDEITDIKFKIEAQSNKENFEDKININLYKDADSLVPYNKTSKKIYYPSHISNVNQEFISAITIEQPNMTICSSCLKTSLGYNEVCPYCDSPHVRHYAEPQPATACHNCGWIINGWNDYCTHCLSYNIDKIQVDFNKTYCEDCHSLSDDYYQNCPQCFSKNVLHLTNTSNVIRLIDNEKNIDTINYNIDTEQQINILNISIPLSQSTASLSELEYLDLHIAGENKNLGEYYYCEACGKGGIGNYKKCPDCNSTLVHNYKTQSPVLKVYNSIAKMQWNREYAKQSRHDSRIKVNIPTENTIYAPKLYSIDGKFDITIPIYNASDDCYAKQNDTDRFKLLLYVENQVYDEVIKNVLNLPIPDEYQGAILSEITPFNFTIDNIYYDYRYINEIEWTNLDKLTTKNHSYIHYSTPLYAKESDALLFDKFDIPKGDYKEIDLYISGLIKNNNKYNVPTMNITIYNNNSTSVHKISIHDILFSNYINLTNFIGEYINDISIKIDFSNINNQDINITDVHLIAHKIQHDIHYPDKIEKIPYTIVKENSHYLIESDSNNLWGVNNNMPYYLSGSQLETNLLACIDFGTLNLTEYIRIYNIEMIIYYKNKMGQITTANISPENNKSYLAIKKSNVAFDENNIEQILSGSITKTNSEILGNIIYPISSLNNLEYEVTNINEDGSLVNDIPLHYKLAQSFKAKSSSISTVYLNYFGQRGYPNDTIVVHICKDNNNTPGSIIQSTIAKIPKTAIININFNIYDLTVDKQYWIVIEDTSANENNYHRFKYNNNTKIGNLIHYTNGTYTYDSNNVLSFSIDSIDNQQSKSYWQLPATWTLNIDTYKIQNILYRYNVLDESNVTLSNFNIKSGYYFIDY